MINTPYLQLRGRLSQVWLNKYTILAILIALKIALFKQSLGNAIKTTKEFTLGSCPSIDSFASNAVSVPHYLSKSANYMILKTVDGINDATKETLKLILTGSEQLIIFAIEMVIGTYACLLVSAVDGAVDAAVNSTEQVIGWVNNSVGDIADDINNGLTDISEIINKVANAAEDIKDFFTGDDDNEGESAVSKVNLSISALRELHIPSSINTKLESLKENTPDFDTVKNKTENLIKTPFELVKSKLDATTLVSNDADDLYVPPLTQSTICSGNTDKIKEFYFRLGKDISICVNILVALLVLAAFLAMVPLVYAEFRKWTRLQALQKDEAMDEKTAPRDVIDSYERVFNKYPTKLGLWLSSFSNVPETKNRIRWVASYALSSSSLVIMGIALAGILTAILQFIILSILNKSIHDNKSGFNEIGNSLSKQVSDSISNWTNSTNDYLSTRETDMNDELFSMVKETTDSVNDTIAEFVEDMNKVIADAFNGTILYAPVKSVVGCVIEDKLLKIEKGLTWIHDNAHIKLPRVNETYITQGMDTSSNSTSSNSTESQMVSKAAELVKTSETMMTKMLKTTVQKYKESTMLELYISLALLAIWFVQVLVAVAFAFYDSQIYGSDAVDISYPKQLSLEERLKYGYPYSTSTANGFALRELNHSEDTLDEKDEYHYNSKDFNSYRKDVRSNPFLSGAVDNTIDFSKEPPSKPVVNQGSTIGTENPFDDSFSIMSDPFGDNTFSGVKSRISDEHDISKRYLA